MNKKKYAISLFLCTLISHTSTYSYADSLIKTYQETLNQEELELRTQLMTMVNIKDKSAWETLKNEQWEDYKDACALSTSQELADIPIPEELITAIYSVLCNPIIKSILGVKDIQTILDAKQIKIHRYNRPDITIACANDTLEADAATDQFTILLEPKFLLETHQNAAEIQATIAHEIIHILAEDDFHLFCINEAKKSARVSQKKFRTMKGKWERAQEKRADIMSGLINFQYAKANKHHFKRHMPAKEKLGITDTHPTHRQRYKYLKKLVTKMEKTKNKELFSSLVLFLCILLLGFISIIISNKKTKIATS